MGVVLFKLTCSFSHFKKGKTRKTLEQELFVSRSYSHSRAGLCNPNQITNF